MTEPSNGDPQRLPEAIGNWQACDGRCPSLDAVDVPAAGRHGADWTRPAPHAAAVIQER